MKLNTMDEYLAEIQGMSIPQNAIFHTNPSLTEKIGHLGELLPFCGNTTVFLLSAEDRSYLAQLQHELYINDAGLPPDKKVLAQPLRHSTFHMTLHDLLNSPASRIDEEFLRRCTQIREQAQRIITPMHYEPDLCMEGNWLFNMVGSSIVLLLRPTDSHTESRLEAMYDALEALVPLGYPMTPHITLAYFRPGSHLPDATAYLRQLLRPIDHTFHLSMKDLVVQTFTDMNHYTTVPTDIL